MKSYWINEIKKSFFTSLWFMLLTFPMVVMRVNTIGSENGTVYRWNNFYIVGIGAFFLSWLWRYLLERKEHGGKRKENVSGLPWVTRGRELLGQPKIRYPMLAVFIMFVVLYPLVFSMYQTNIMISALIYVMLGLGLNIVVGLGGILHLGYAAFYAVGAYTYALIFRFTNEYFMAMGWNNEAMFWIALPIAGGVSALFGIILTLPVLRLRGDYLAIVTLSFGEITRMILQNWDKVTLGPSGIPNVPRPWFFGIRMTPVIATKYIYYILIGLVVLTIFVVRRLENSRLGRAWEAMREDEIASQAMGINISRAKLTTFALGALWAGFAGVLLAAKTTVVNPNSFTIWESVIVLCVVVLGGMGSIPGVILGALIIVLLPEYLRAFSQFRMLIFGLALVLMMIFRPSGIIKKVRKKYEFHDTGEQPLPKAKAGGEA